MHLLLCGLFLVVTAAAAPADDFKPEPGFTPLFNGKDLSGWKTKGTKDKTGESLEGKAEAFGGRFKVKDGELVIDPKVKGDVRIETAKEYAKDVTIRLEYLPGEGCNNDLFFRGQKFDLSKENVKNIKFGEWNQIEIAVTGDKVEIKSNGETARSATTKVEKSTFEIRAEFGPIQIRRLRIKEGG
ncbi:MAG TPA: DUF1080 domain-containing protein [Gemmataceae bacterium]|nr:DUF1080 domain-containing protein [Gemmataceae bacterium]